MGQTARRRWTAGLAVFAGLAAIAVLAIAVVRGPIADTLEFYVGVLQNAVAHSLGDAALGGPRLYGVAFVGGLVASFSPCILGMLPVNLSYIGAAGVTSKRRALVLASTFVAGVVLVNAIVGLFSSAFFAVFVQYRSVVNIIVGIVTVLMGLWMAGLIPLRVPTASRIPSGSGPFVVGIVFALVASPCASPVLIAVLAAAAKTGSPLQSALAMTVYAIGYTALLFLASVSAGIAAASRRLLNYSSTIQRLAAAALVVVGAFTLWYGLTVG